MSSLSKCSSILAIVAACGAISSLAHGQTVFYQENFDSAVRNVLSNDPRVTSACNAFGAVSTHNPPAGWVNDICGVPTYACRVGPIVCPGTTCRPACGNAAGFREYEGWAFSSKSWWIAQQGDQNRSQFTKGIGNVAIADPDGWDDKGSPASNCGFFNAFMRSPVISLAGVDLSTVQFTFDSSWRYEGFDDADLTNNQTATIFAIYTVNGAPVRVPVLKWDSDDGANSGTLTPSPTFKPDATNETVTLTPAQLAVPAGATNVRFEFGMTKAANDWWWAVDNLRLAGTLGATPDSQLWAENFEGVTLELPIDSIPAGCGVTYCGVFTHTHVGPNGVTVTNDPSVTGGVADWNGWSFVDRAFWACASGGPNGSAFNGASGIIAVADGDEWTDISPNSGTLNTVMSTPAINISARTGNVLVLSFNSSWRWEAGQTANIIAEYTLPSGTQSVEVLRWESDTASLNFKADAVDEVAAVGLNIPTGATAVRFKFGYIAGNNWWWAIDNVRLFQGQATIVAGQNTPQRAPMALAPSIDYAACATPWSPTLPTGWTTLFSPNGCTTVCGRPEWSGFAVADKAWWIQIEGDQDRSLFTRGTGFVAVADPDAWDDQPNGRAEFNAFATTPSIALPASRSSFTLSFDSSWRYEGFDDACGCDVTNFISGIAPGTAASITTLSPHGLSTGDRVIISGSNSTPSIDGTFFLTVTGPSSFTVPVAVTGAGTTAGTAVRTESNNQTATIAAIYTTSSGPVRIEVLRWDSNDGSIAGQTPSPFFKPDAPNEAVTLTAAQLQAPANATAVRFEFGLTKARNDWWWAIDNVVVGINGLAAFTENFENAPNLQIPPTEAPPTSACLYFSTVAQQGGNLTTDNTGLNANCAIDDFKGFAAWYVPAWASALGGTRGQFAPELAYISDFSASGTGCDGTARLISPSYGILSFNPNTVKITFQSAWLSGVNHNSSVDISFNGGTTWTPALSWNPSNKVSNPNETVVINVANSANTSTLRLRFSDSNSGYWAISGWSVTGVVGSGNNCRADINNSGTVSVQDIFDFLSLWFAGDIRADINNSGAVSVQDIFDFLSLWFLGC